MITYLPVLLVEVFEAHIHLSGAAASFLDAIEYALLKKTSTVFRGGLLVSKIRRCLQLLLLISSPFRSGSISFRVTFYVM